MRPERQLLYVSPYFPPLCRVGALRPLKFCRHLPAQGWRPHVLCDFHPGYALDAGLLAALPPEVAVHRSYSYAARSYGRAPMPRPGQALRARPPRSGYPNEDVMPLGHHALDVPHALGAGARLLAQQPCDAILVNADPFAALLVGAELARRHALPLIADLRDPWALCALRRPRRGPVQRWVIDAMEASVLRRAARVILNTEQTRRDYAAHYPAHAHKLEVIRNHSDASLVGLAAPIRFDRFTVLFAGSLRRDLDGRAVVGLLRALAARNVMPAQLQLALPEPAVAALLAEGMPAGLRAFVRGVPHTPHRQLGALLSAADLLLAVSHVGAQRIPAKIYDYLAAPRPVLACTDNPELVELSRDLPGTDVVGLDDSAAAAEVVLAALSRGRQQHVVRPARFESAEATRKLAAVLDAAVMEARLSA